MKRLEMTQLPSEKFNVAWFKLAEFVARKDKERAFTLFRLLVHALQDTAFVAQLEGDLLFAFKDERAIDLYKRAALLYEDAGRMIEAVAVYERMMQFPLDQDHSVKLHALYQAVGQREKIAPTRNALS